MTSSSIQIADQLALRIETEVRYQMDSILEKIHTLATEYKIASKDKKSPFRNVLSVAVEPGTSLEIIKNYIRYQVGRGGNASPIWSLRGSQEQKLFAQELVAALDNLAEDVDHIISRVKTALGESSNPKTQALTDDLSAAESSDEDSVPQAKSRPNESTDAPSEEALGQKDLDNKPTPEQQKLLDHLADGDNQTVLKQSLHLKLAQLYLGYLAREHTAQVGEKGATSAAPTEKTSAPTPPSPKDKPKRPKKQNRR